MHMSVYEPIRSEDTDENTEANQMNLPMRYMGGALGRSQLTSEDVTP